MIFTYLNAIFRRLRKNGSFTLINVAGLAFGFACAILIILHASKEKSYNSAIPEHDRIFNLLQKSPQSPLGITTINYALSPLLAERYPEIEYFARIENFSWFSNCIVSTQASPDQELLSFNEPDFYLADTVLFRILQYPFIEGSAEDALSTPQSIVLSKETAEKYFKDKPALGKTLVLNSENIFTVSGVVDLPEYVTIRFAMLAPITTLRSESELRGWDSNGDPLFMLNKNVDYQQFNKKIEHFLAEYKPEALRNPEELTLSLLPITERRLYYNKNPLFLLIFIGIVVLVISVLNYVNLSTSLVQKRTREIAMKKIAGASKSLIGRQFMGETLIIGFVAILVGGILAVTGIPFFRKLAGSDLQPYLENHLNLFIVGSLLLWLLTSLLAGLYPSLVLSGLKPLLLFNKDHKVRSGMLSKNILITFQFVISIILVILTLMINRQYRYMENMSLGFDNEWVMQLPFTNKLKDNFTNLKEELIHIPGVKEACAASSMPAGIPNHAGVSWIDDEQNRQQDNFGFAIVSEGYTQTFSMHLLLGDEFVRERPEQLEGVIINETAAARLGFENPIGKQLLFWGRNNPIIGVVEDFQNNFLFNRVKPMVISAHPGNQGFTKYLYVSLYPEHIDRTIRQIEHSLKEISPGYPFEYHFTTAEVRGYINEIKEVKRSFVFASIVAILLALVGLVALSYHTTQARIKEIGIRKVNGARNIEIVSLVNSALLRSVLLAFIIAAPAGWLIMNNLLRGFGNKTTIAWWVFALAGILALGSALITVSWQGWRAATRNPVETLRYE